MNTHDRKLLATALGDDLPHGYSTEKYDDFVNFAFTGFQGQRVIRVVGPGRILVLFAYDEWPFMGRQVDYKLYFLHENNEMVEFNPETAKIELRAAHEKGWSYAVGWERAAGWWLVKQGARQFKGHGWAADCAMKVLNLVRRWEKHYCGLPEGYDEETTG